MPTAYYDGKFVDGASLAINPSDFGFSRGISVFELARVYGGTPFRLQDHLTRLNNGAQMLGIKIPALEAQLLDAVSQICTKNSYAHSLVKFYLTAGECGKPDGNLAMCEGFTPHLMIIEEEFKPAHPEAPYGMDRYKKGQRLKTVPYMRELPTVKSINYSVGYHAALKAGKEWDDILFTRHDGIVTEATRSNFFCVIDGTLCTAKSGMLFGVTRKVVLEIAAKLAIPVKECDLTVADISKATEAFTTGSIAELVPACQIDTNILATTTEGPVYKTLRQAFSALIAENSPSQKQGLVA